MKIMRPPKKRKTSNKDECVGSIIVGRDLIPDYKKNVPAAEAERSEYPRGYVKLN